MNPPLLPRSLRRLLFAAALAACASSCRSGPIGRSSPLPLEDVPAIIERAGAAPLETIDSDDLAEIVGGLVRAERAALDSDQRVTVRRLLEQTSEEFAKRGDDPDDLEDLTEVDLPARIAVPAGLRAARILRDDNKRSDAFNLMRRLDERYPAHALRNEAGDLLFSIAESYRNDKRRRLFLFPYSSRAPAVYEYLSTEYPTHESADDALLELAKIYEEAKLFDVAIDKHQELVLWARDSPHRIASEAAIPQLRLDDLDGPEYGRDELVTALDELDLWLERYRGHELQPDVDRARVDCLQRLADNDLVVAHFYARVSSPEGARQHAERGLEFALRAGNEEQQGEIREFLASVDEIERVEAPDSLPGAPSLEIFDDSGSGTSAPAGLAPSDPLDEPVRRREFKDTEPEPRPGLETPDPVDPPPPGNGGGS